MPRTVGADVEGLDHWHLGSTDLWCLTPRRPFYSADWKPAAASRRHTGRVLEVFWRCPAVLWGPSTPNPAWVLGKTLIFKNWPIFIICMWNGVDLPHVPKHAFGDQMGPNVQKAMPFCNPPHQGLKNCGLSHFLIFRPFFRVAGVLFAVCALLAIFRGWPYYLAVPAAPGRLNTARV